MLRIRLQRKGRKKRPFYFVVVVPNTQRPKGKFVEKLGFYNPISQPKEFKINIERFKYWMSVGAQPSETLIKLIYRFVDDKALIKEYGFDKFIEELKKKPKRSSKKQVEDSEKASSGGKEDVEKTEIEEQQVELNQTEVVDETQEETNENQQISENGQETEENKEGESN